MPTTFVTRALRRAPVLTATLFLAGCATMTAGNGTTGKAVCDSFRPVLWSDADSDETIRQVKANNAVGAAICGWRG